MRVVGGTLATLFGVYVAWSTFAIYVIGPINDRADPGLAWEIFTVLVSVVAVIAAGLAAAYGFARAVPKRVATVAGIACVPLAFVWAFAVIVLRSS